MSWGVPSQSPCKQLSVLSEKSKTFTSGSTHDLFPFQYLLNVLLNKDNLSSQDLVLGSAAPSLEANSSSRAPRPNWRNRRGLVEAKGVLTTLPHSCVASTSPPKSGRCKGAACSSNLGTSVNWRGSLAPAPTTRWVKHEVFRHAAEKWKRRCKNLCLDLPQAV